MKFLKLISWKNYFFFPGRYCSVKTMVSGASFSKQQYAEILEMALSKCKCYLEMSLDSRKESLWAWRFICVFWTSGNFPALIASPACTMILFVPRNNIIRFTAEQQRERESSGETQSHLPERHPYVHLLCVSSEDFPGGMQFHKDDITVY